MSKARTPISAEITAEVLFASDRTCCVCNERGKAVQIHHVDEDPANNGIENLAVLCLECHNDTQLHGGFGRKLNADLVGRYREDWLSRVQKRREESDTQAIARMVGTGSWTKSADEMSGAEKCADVILQYVNILPEIRAEIRSKLQPQLDSGSTAEQMEASYAYVDALQGILVTLAKFYPKGSFGGSDPHRFISEVISSRYSWHWSHAEPFGPGKSGTIVNLLVAGNVMSDVEDMVSDVVHSLVGFDDRFAWKEWPGKWRGEI